jgi:hypothetical protein
MWGDWIARARHWHAVIRRSVWRFVALFFSVAGALAFVRDEFLSPKWQARLKMPAWLPAWPWYWWAIAALLVAIAAILEGSYREFRELSGSRRNTGESDNTIKTAITRNGKTYVGTWYGSRFGLDEGLIVWGHFEDSESTIENVETIDVSPCEPNSIGHFSYVSPHAGNIAFQSLVDGRGCVSFQPIGTFDALIGAESKLAARFLRYGHSLKMDVTLTLTGWTRAGKN